MKTCTVEGCDNTHRARGLCSTHYNQQHQPDQHARVTTVCVVCSAPILRSVKSTRRHTCSVACRNTLAYGTTAGDRYQWATDAARRARYAGATVIEIVEREDILERDGYQCYLCDIDTNPLASPFDPTYPTVDHVVPLSRGGQHTAANLRCACLHCNSSKQKALIDISLDA